MPVGVFPRDIFFLNYYNIIIIYLCAYVVILVSHTSRASMKGMFVGGKCSGVYVNSLYFVELTLNLCCCMSLHCLYTVYIDIELPYLCRCVSADQLQTKPIVSWCKV